MTRRQTKKRFQKDESKSSHQESLTDIFTIEQTPAKMPKIETTFVSEKAMSATDNIIKPQMVQCDDSLSCSSIRSSLCVSVDESPVLQRSMDLDIAGYSSDD
jgi:hypothetical protein